MKTAAQNHQIDSWKTLVLMINQLTLVKLILRTTSKVVWNTDWSDWQSYI